MIFVIVSQNQGSQLIVILSSTQFKGTTMPQFLSLYLYISVVCTFQYTGNQLPLICSVPPMLRLLSSKACKDAKIFENHLNTVMLVFIR